MSGSFVLCTFSSSQCNVACYWQQCIGTLCSQVALKKAVCFFWLYNASETHNPYSSFSPLPDFLGIRKA